MRRWGEGRLTEQNRGGGRDIFRRGQRLPRHDGDLEAESYAEAGKGLVSDPDGAGGRRGERVDQTAANGGDDGPENDERGKVAEACDADTRGDDCQC